MIDDDGTFDDAQDEVQEVEKSLIQMLGMSKPAGYNKYCLKRKIPPLGANVTTSGNLYVPIRDDELKLKGILEIDAHGARLIHKDEPLQGSAVAIGPFNDAPVIAVALEWESAVALHIVLGGMTAMVNAGFDLTRDKVVRSKEKFGCLSLDVNIDQTLSGDDLRRTRIHEAIRLSNNSARVCEVCGQAGHQLVSGSYRVSRCAEHVPEGAKTLREHYAHSSAAI